MAEEPPSEDPEEQPEEQESTPEETPEEQSSSEEEISPEELAMEYVEEAEQEESGEESEPEEESEEPAGEPETPEEPPEQETSEEPESPEEEPEQAGASEESAEFDEQSEEQQSEEQESDEPSMEEPSGEQPGESPEEQDEIRDMLEEEARRSRGEELEEAETEREDLPEGYLSVEELPSAEPAGVPDWFKTLGWMTLGGVIGLIFTWFVLMPLWETYHQVQAHRQINQGNFEAAEQIVHRGMIFGGAFLQNPDPFLADYLKRLLERKKLKRFRDEFKALRASAFGPRTLQIQGQYNLFIKNYQTALELSLDLRTYPETRYAAYLLGARARLGLEQYDRVPSEIRNARQMNPRNAALIRVQRDFALAESNARQAFEHSQRLRGLAEQSERFQLRSRDFVVLSEIYAQLGRPESAEDVLATALQLDPHSYKALSSLIRRYLFSEQWGNVSNWIEGTAGRPSFREQYPQEALAWWGEAEYLLNTGEDRRPIDLLRRAYWLEGRNPEVYRVRGMMYLEHFDRPDLAVEQLRRARTLGLRRLPALHHLARAEYQAGNYEHSIELLEQIQEQVEEPSDELKYNLASAYLGARQTEVTRNLLQQLMDGGYRPQEVYIQLGLSYLADGDDQQALSKLFQGIERAETSGVSATTTRKLLDQLLDEQSPNIDRQLAPMVRNPGLEYWQTLEQQDETS